MKRAHSAKLCDQMAEGSINPFWTIEAIQEHCGMLWIWYSEHGYSVPPIENGQRKPLGCTGDFDHELITIEGYVQNVLDMVAALAHDLYLASDGDQSALERIRPHLQAMAEENQQRWESFR